MSFLLNCDRTWAETIFYATKEEETLMHPTRAIYRFSKQDRQRASERERERERESRS